MEHIYKFTIARLSPNDSRGECLNVGLIIFKDDGLDVRPARRLEKVRAISARLEGFQIRDLLYNFVDLDRYYAEIGISDIKSRLSLMIQGAPLTLSEFGTFVAQTPDQYEERVAKILHALIEPEPGRARVKEKRSRLLTAVKSAFRDHKVLARAGETIDSHRIVTKFEIDDGLTADLALKNGAMHIIETVDASGDENSFKNAISQIGVAALVLERAEMHYGDSIKKQLVYTASPAMERIAMPSLEAVSHRGTVLTNWASAAEQRQFVEELSSLAAPIERKKNKPRSVRFGP